MFMQGGDVAQHASLTALISRLREQGRPLLCVDMGSNARMGLLPEPARFVETLVQALNAADCCGLLLTGSYAPLAGDMTF